MKMCNIVICFLLVACGNETSKKSIENQVSTNGVVSIEIENVDTTYYDFNLALKNSEYVVELFLRDKGITELSNEIKQFPNLKLLDISLNPISDLPPEIFKLRNLEYLAVADCKLEKLSGSIGNLLKLERLELLNNNLHEIPEELCNLDKLEYLNISGNEELKPPRCLENLKSLKALWFLEENGKSLFSEADFVRLKNKLPDTNIK